MKHNTIDYPLDLLHSYIKDPSNPDINFQLGTEYHRMGQTATAVSFYVRAAERSDNKDFQYECMIRSAMCFEKQGARYDSVTGFLQHAIALLTTRPEAYFLLSRYYEASSRWFDGYLISTIGWELSTDDHPPLMTDVEYPGRYGLLFERAVTSWWCGLCDQSLELFYELLNNYELDFFHKQAVKANIERLDKTDKSKNHLKNIIFTKENNMETYIDTRPGEEDGLIHTNRFSVNNLEDKRLFVVDNFYQDPYAVREFALAQTYYPGEGGVGHRTRKQFLFEGVRESFESIIGEKILDHSEGNHGWLDLSINGRFQYVEAGTPSVYHCDHQQWAAIVYLTPDAPPESGTAFYRNKQSKAYHSSQVDWSQNEGNELFNGKTWLDGTPYEMVDTVGNVFNRLVIFDGQLLHAGKDYFGWDRESSRLFHIFFFNTH